MPAKIIDVCYCAFIPQQLILFIFATIMKGVLHKLLPGNLKEPTPFILFISLIVITLLSMLLFSVIGIILSSIVYHLPVADINLQLGDQVNPDKINALKLLQFVSAAGTFILPPFLVLRFFRVKSSSFLKTTIFPTALFLVQATLVFIIIFPFLEWLISFNSTLSLPESLDGVENWMRAREDELTGVITAFLQVTSLKGLLGNLLVIALVPAIGEELFFRGMIQNLLKKGFKNIHWAIFITAFIFSTVHMQFYGFLPRLLLGVILGYLYYWSGSIWGSIYFHFLNNALAVIFSYLSNRNFINFQLDEPMNTSNLVIIISFAITAIFFIALAVYYDKKRKNNSDWIKIFSTSNMPEAEIYHGVLENEEIPAIIMNKKDSSIQTFGQIELYVKPEDKDRALEIIREDMNEKLNNPAIEVEDNDTDE